MDIVKSSKPRGAGVSEKIIGFSILLLPIGCSNKTHHTLSSFRGMGK
ncbi:MAG: hypothetical protein AB8W37_11895 [Arsenophonus endosymbiont of Dermacentor nuttalli]